MWWLGNNQDKAVPVRALYSAAVSSGYLIKNSFKATKGGLPPTEESKDLHATTMLTAFYFVSVILSYGKCFYCGATGTI